VGGRQTDRPDPAERGALAPPPPPLLTRRRLLIGGALVLLSVGVVTLIGKAAGYARLLDQLQGADAAWLALALGTEAFSILGYTVVLREVARFDGGPALSSGDAAWVMMASDGAIRVGAIGGAGGLAFTYWSLTKAGATVHDAVRRVVALNVLVLAVFAAGGWSGALALAAGADEAPWQIVIPWLAAVPALAVVFFWTRQPARRAGLEHRRLWRLVRASVDDAAAGVVLARRLAGRPRSHAVALAGVMLYWASDCASLWACLQSFDVQLSIPLLVLAYTTGYAVSLLPLPLAGVGSVDAALTGALVGVGVGLAPALAVVVAYRFFSFWLPTPLYLAALATAGRLERRLARYATD
jgi:uncharacterized membrane protein YbhN (UPF0104 family)